MGEGGEEEEGGGRKKKEKGEQSEDGDEELCMHANGIIQGNAVKKALYVTKPWSSLQTWSSTRVLTHH